MSTATGLAVIARKAGGPEVLTLIEREFADPAAGSVRVAVDTAGVAYGDLLLREGVVPGVLRPVTPGYDAIGRVDAIGAGVTSMTIGDRVAVRTAGQGTYATHVESPLDFVVPVPESVDAAPTVALVLNYVTAWQMLTRVAPVGPGGTVVVHSATGGVGSALTQLAAVRGLRVIGTASAPRMSALEASGVRAVERGTGWDRAVRAAAPHGVDAVFDGIGGRTGQQSFRLLGAGGQLVTYGATGALKNGRRSLTGLARAALGSVRPSGLTLLSRGVGVNGYLSASYVPAHPAWYREDLMTLLDLLAKGRIRPAIAARLPLAQAADAQRMLADGVAGKVVLITDGATK